MGEHSTRYTHRSICCSKLSIKLHNAAVPSGASATKQWIPHLVCWTLLWLLHPHQMKFLCDFLTRTGTFLCASRSLIDVVHSLDSTLMTEFICWNRPVSLDPLVSIHLLILASSAFASAIFHRNEWTLRQIHELKTYPFCKETDNYHVAKHEYRKPDSRQEIASFYFIHCVPNGMWHNRFGSRACLSWACIWAQWGPIKSRRGPLRGLLGRQRRRSKG